MGAPGLPESAAKAASLSRAPRSFVPGHFRRVIGRGLRAALGGRSQAGAPGRSARALLAADHRRRAPPAGPGARLLPGTRSQAAPLAPGRGGAPPGPRGEPSPVRSHGEVQGWAKASPAGPPVRRGREDRGQSPVARRTGGQCQAAPGGAVQTHRGHGHSVATEYGLLRRMR